MKYMAPFLGEFIRLTADAFRKGWHERNGGNLSYRMRAEDLTAVQDMLKAPESWLPIGINVPGLAGEHFLVTGSGKHMRNVSECPEDNIAIIKIDEKGENFSILWGLVHGGRPTSELPTHLMNHEIVKRRSEGRYRIIYHAHPVNAIALTFVLPLEDRAFTKELWGMMTECPIIFPQGVGVVPWMVPGGSDIAKATGKLIEKYDVVIWAHHGVFCAGPDFDEVFGLMDTVEKSAEISVKVRSMGGAKQGISDEEFRSLEPDFKVHLNRDFV